MGFWSAFLVFAVGTSCLFYLDREKSIRNSKALWLPVILLWIVGSRPASVWLAIWFGIGGFGGAGSGLDSQLDGSPMDALVLALLLVAGIAVLYRRKKRAIALLKASGPILIYFLYCLVSCLWSPFPDVAFKRWIKDVGELAMVLVVVTDDEPIIALCSIFSRVGFILFPATIFLIRYSVLGRGFDPDGLPMNTGVTTNKNTLGLIAFVISLGALWSLLALLSRKRQPYRARQLVARCSLVGLGITVLYLAHSATAIGCFSLGSTLILATHLPFIRRSPARVQALVLTILFGGGGFMLFGGAATVMGALGRDTTLTGRTTIWKAAIPLCPNVLVGAGFESFWNGYGKNVKEGLSQYERGLNSAHNGYIDVYLNLGVVGVALIGLLLFSGYRSACAAFRRNPQVGSLMLAYVATSLIYSVTEAGFRILTPTWISLLLAIVASNGATIGLFGGLGKPARARARPVEALPTSHELASTG